jgi:hypothetical protein
MRISRPTQLSIISAFVAVAVVCTVAGPLHDGSSEKNALILSEQSIENCVDAEHAYIHSHFPDVSLDGFEHGTIVGKQGIWYDVFRFSTKDGKKHELYFDSTRCRK